MKHLLAAARVLTGLEQDNADWTANSGIPIPLDTAAFGLAAQRAARCLAVMQQLVEECQVSTFPAPSPLKIGILHVSRKPVS